MAIQRQFENGSSYVKVIETNMKVWIFQLQVKWHLMCTVAFSISCQLVFNEWQKLFWPIRWVKRRLWSSQEKFKDSKKKTSLYSEFAVKSLEDFWYAVEFKIYICILSLNREEVNSIKTKIQGKCQETETLQKKIEENVSMPTKQIINRNTRPKCICSENSKWRFFCAFVDSVNICRRKLQKKKNRSKQWRQR